MTTWNRVQGDVRDTVVAYLYGIQSFAGATVEGHVWSARTTGSTDLVAVVVDGVDPQGVVCGVCTVQLGVTSGWLSTATPGSWYLEHEVTFADNTVLTWPADSPDTIRVRAQASPGSAPA